MCHWHMGHDMYTKSDKIQHLNENFKRHLVRRDKVDKTSLALLWGLEDIGQDRRYTDRKRRSRRHWSSVPVRRSGDSGECAYGGCIA